MNRKPVLHVEITPVRNMVGELYAWRVELIECESQTEPRVVQKSTLHEGVVFALGQAGRLLAEYVPL